MQEIYINVPAVLVAAVSSLVVGGLWYSPLMFAKPWAAAVGLTEEEIRAGGSQPMLYITAFLGGLAGAFVVAVVSSWAEVTSLVDGMLVGLLIGIGAVAANKWIAAGFEKRSKALFLINAGADIVTFAVMGAIIGAWR